MKPPNGRKIILRINSKLQPVGDKTGILSSVLGLLGSDYTKFLICEKDWRKVRTKDKVYNECVKEMFHFDENSGGITKFIILKIPRRAWKETMDKLYHDCYDSERTFEENIKHRPPESLQTIGDGTSIIAIVKRQRHDRRSEGIEAIEQRDKSSKLLSQNDSLAQALAKEHSGRVRGMG
ncbi:uncharacterized protein LOC110266817 [Arachis ipaensis]|uniref:uncharacterized protein LOC110266817 n=1 Tax=Arachis ipaensis TaxID=130454 RepID=UPI000A2B6ACE|nr:uncharacterized protein LOC110266817 [Arachis ipaensis]XP_025678371.1 uncharacterized protein LOC112778250 [Arachis hypogaea]